MTRAEIREAQEENKALAVTVNSATTILAQELSSSELQAIYEQEKSELVTVSTTSSSNAQTKALSASTIDLESLLISKYGLDSLTDLDLKSASSMSQLSLYANKIKRHAILSAIALRSADDGLLTSAGWDAVLVATAAIDSATDPLVAAQTLSNAIKTNLQTSVKVTSSDFGAELQAYLGTGLEIANVLAGLQPGDASGALAFIQITSVSNNYLALNTLYSTADEDMYDGQVTWASSGNWVYHAGTNSDAFTRLGLFNKSFTVTGGYPGELDVEGLTNLDGSEVTASIEKWSDSDYGYLKNYLYPSVFSGNYSHVVEFEMEVDKNLVSGVSLTGGYYKVRALGGLKSLNGDAVWIFELKHCVSYGNYDYEQTVLVYKANYTTSTGSLSLNTTLSEIDENRLVSWLENNTTFLTVTSSYAEKARDSYRESGRNFSAVVDGLQAIDPEVSPRLNNLVESQDDLKHSNGQVFTDAETDGVQVFLKEIVDSLYGATTVNPEVFVGQNLVKGSLDLSVFFEKNYRDVGLINGKVIRDSESELDVDEAQLRSDLSGMLDANTLFGVSLSTVGSY